MTDRVSFRAPKGIPDYLPPESAQFIAVREGLLTAARRAGYGDIQLFHRHRGHAQPGFRGRSQS